MARSRPHTDLDPGAGAVARHGDHLERLLTAAPSWLGSAIVHAIILLVLCQVPWTVPSRPARNTLVSLKPELPEQRLLEREEMVPPPAVPMPEPAGDTLTHAEVDPASADIDFNQPDDVDIPGLSLLTPPNEYATVPQVPQIALGTRGVAIGPRLFSLRRLGRGTSGAGHGGKTDPAEPGRCWLARVQEADGHWDSRKWGANHNCDAAVTGLALFAFLGHGDSRRGCTYWPNVYKGLNWLEKNQRPDGSWPGNFYTNGICTMVMSEAYAMTSHLRWKLSAQKAVNYCCANQNPHGGWDYNGVNPKKVDTSVTGWVVMALKSARAAGLKVPPEAIERVEHWLNASLNPDGTTGYAHQPGGVGSSGGNTAALTAVATLCREFMGWGRHDHDIRRGLDVVAKHGVNINNLYHTYYGTLAMFQYGGKHWVNWRKQFREPLLTRQVRGRGPEFDGSWDTDVTYGKHGGRVYSTAMAVLCLEAEYLYLPMLKRK